MFQELRREEDAYLFSLDHFILMYTDPTTRAANRMRLPPLPHDASDDCEHLVLDALRTGNVARFINHR